MSKQLQVVAGNRREPVGTIEARKGMLTNAGRIKRVTEKSVVFESGVRRLNLDGVTVRHTEALRFGYPFSQGSIRFKTVNNVRNGKVLSN